MKFYGLKFRALYLCFNQYGESHSRKIFKTESEAIGYTQEFKQSILDKTKGSPFGFDENSIKITVVDYDLS